MPLSETPPVADSKKNEPDPATVQGPQKDAGPPANTTPPTVGPAPHIADLAAAIREAARGPALDVAPPTRPEIRPGGAFRVNDRLVDAEGKLIQDDDKSK